ncbi:hypothetical protein Btru_012298 [Bulinus truncatus]|nr:hypothetical protein Btru_012298 [Bulinus truncatus]
MLFNYLRPTIETANSLLNTKMQLLVRSVIFFASFTGIIVLSDQVSDIAEIDSVKWQKSLDERQKLLVLFYKTENCDSCATVLNVFNQIVGQPELPSDIIVGKSADLSLAEHLKITAYPSLIFLRDNSIVLFDDAYEIERLLEWIQLAAQKTTHTLDDTSFEHLTQAASGATTGDWLVAFYKDSCSTVLPAMESFGVRVRNRINVAKVNTDESPVLVERFKITKCPEIIYFKQGKMYRFDFPALDVPSFKSFVDAFYKNVKAEGVPIPKSKFDYLTENIADILKQQLNGENRTVIIASAGATTAVLFLLTVLCCCCCSADKQHKKQKRD